jgi:hypothetical protein
VILCRHAPEVTYEELQADVQAQLGISRARLGGVLTSLAGARKRLPRDVDYPIERDKDLRRYLIEPVAAQLLLGAVERVRAAGLVTGEARPMLSLPARQARLDRPPRAPAWRRSRRGRMGSGRSATGT